MNYFIVDAFTDKPFGGNPAGVVLLESDAFPTEELMLIKSQPCSTANSIPLTMLTGVEC